MSDQADEQSVEDRMLAVLEKEEGQPEDPQEEATDTEEQQTEETPESEEDQPEERVFKLKRDDQEVDVPEPEVIELAQKGYDYTIKTQQVAAERKAVEDRAQALMAQEQGLKQQFELQNALIDERAKVSALDNQIAQYSNVDWQTLSNTDPVQAQTLFFQYQALKDQRGQAVENYNRKQQEFAQKHQETLQARVSEGLAQLRRDIPDWSQDKAKQVREAGKAYGYSEQEMDQFFDPRLVRLMHDAAQFRALKQSQPTVTKKLADKPAVVKPSGKDAKAVARNNHAELKSQLRKTGDQHLAAKLIERMI